MTGKRFYNILLLLKNIAYMQVGGGIYSQASKKPSYIRSGNKIWPLMFFTETLQRCQLTYLGDSQVICANVTV